MKNHNFKTYSFDPLVEQEVKEEEVLKNLKISKMIILLVDHDSLESICEKINYIHWEEII